VHHRSGAGRLAAYRQTLQLVANWRRSSIANTCGCRCIHLRFVGCHNKRIFIYLVVQSTYLFEKFVDPILIFQEPVPVKVKNATKICQTAKPKFSLPNDSQKCQILVICQLTTMSKSKTCFYKQLPPVISPRIPIGVVPHFIYTFSFFTRGSI